MKETSEVLGARKRRARSVGREHLADAVYQARNGLSRSDARALVDDFLEEFADGLLVDRTLLLTGIGKFTVVRTIERVGRNPKTGEEYVISSRNVVRFRPSRLLLELVQATKLTLGRD
jgi:integration host factor subunit alpha